MPPPFFGKKTPFILPLKSSTINYSNGLQKQPQAALQAI